MFISGVERSYMGYWERNGLESESWSLKDKFGIFRLWIDIERRVIFFNNF